MMNVDLQNHFVENAPHGFTVLERVNRLAAACRRAGILVVHTAHVLRRDGSNTGVLGELVPSVPEEGFLYEGSRTAALHDNLVIEPGDVVLHKPRFGAFHGTDLELILRGRGIDTIIVSGISTDVCCDTTAREANARDFRVLFISDATAVNTEDADEAERQRQATLGVIDGLFGQVVTMGQLLAKIGSAADQDSAATTG